MENLPLGALDGRPLAGPFVCRRVSFKVQTKRIFAHKKAKKNFLGGRKTMKKVLSVALASAMVLGMGANAFAISYSTGSNNEAD